MVQAADGQDFSQDSQGRETIPLYNGPHIYRVQKNPFLNLYLNQGSHLDFETRSLKAIICQK